MGRERATMVALLIVAVLVASIPNRVVAITTTDALIEATHTTLPVTLGELDSETTPEHTSGSVDLSEAETKDPTQRLEIIKQIRKVNHDGSYTVGYEAEDGTFKIESRDVLGNIKGTYGYIDANGDIKRVSYGGQPTRSLPMVTTPATPEEEIVHIPPRFNRSQQLLVPTTRRPPNYQPPQHLHHNPQHASTLRPSVIQTIPRKRHGYMSTVTPTTSTGGSTVAMGGLSSTTRAPTTTTTPSTTTTTTTERTVTMAATEMGGSLAASFGEPTAASTHTSSTHTKPGTLLIIRPTPLPYQSGKTAEQLVRPERLEAAKYTHAPAPSKKPVRGNFLRRQLAPATSESGEQYEAQPQQIIYGQSAADGDLGGIFTGGAKPLYTAHPTPRIPAAVLAARQRAAHLQSVLQSQAAQGNALPERLTTERVYVKQPARPPGANGHRHEPAPIVYETSTEPSPDHGYVTDGPAPSSVVQIPAANRLLAANEAEPHLDDRRPIFRPRPIEFRPRDDSSSPAPGRFRTPYGLPPPYARSFTPLPPPQEAYGGRPGTIPDIDDKDREVDEPSQQQHHLNTISPYRQQRRLNGGLPLPAADTGYQQQQLQQQPQQQQHQQQQQNSYPIPVPYSPAQYPGHLGGRLPSSPYYYDIPAERPLTARDFERILQLLIFRHQQQQVAQQVSRYRLGGGYNGGFGGGYPYNPYFPGPSPSPFGLGGPYLGGGYPQQQIPRPPLPFPYPGGPYDGQGYQNPLYSPSAPSASVRGGADGGQSEADGGYGTVLPASTAARRNGQYYQQPLEVASPSAAGSGSLRATDYLPPEVRESLLYRMLMLAIQAPGSGEVLPLAAPTGPSNGQHPLHHLQGASSMPRPQTQPGHPSPVNGRPDGQGTVTAAAAAAATMVPMYSKKPVRSVQILGEE